MNEKKFVIQEISDKHFTYLGGERYIRIDDEDIIDGNRIVLDETDDVNGRRQIILDPPKPKVDEWEEWKRDMKYQLENCGGWSRLLEIIIDTFDRVPRCKCGKGD